MSDPGILHLHRGILSVRLENGALRLETADRLVRVPLRMLTRLVVHGSVPVASNVWTALASLGIEAVILPGRGRGRPAYLGAGLTSFAQWRIAQHAAYRNEADRLAMMRVVAGLKLRACLGRAERLGGGDLSAALAKALVDLETAQTPEAVRGIEGAAAARWFEALRRTLPVVWGFTGRNRRPPRDPVNALLSLGYTMVIPVVRHAVIAQGLDPALGFLHNPAPDREALVLDAQEPLRPAVDCLMLDLLSRFSLQDFSCSQVDGCRLSRSAKALFYRLWHAASASAFGGLFVEEKGGSSLPNDSGTPPGVGPAGNEKTWSDARAAREAVRRIRHALPPPQGIAIC